MLEFHSNEKAPLCGDSVSNPWGIPHSGWGIVPAVILDDLQIDSMYRQSLRHSKAVSPPFTQGRLKGWSLRCATSPCTGEAWIDGGFPSEGSNQRSAKKEKAPLCGDSVSNPWGIPQSDRGIVPAIILDNLQIGSLCKQSLRRHRYAWSAPPFAGGRLT